MNTIEALLALSALTLSIGVLLNGVNLTRVNFELINNSLNAKTSSMKCAFVIDSIISNSATTYTESLNCDANNNQVSSTKNNQTKKTFILTQSENQFNLVVKKIEHYK